MRVEGTSEVQQRSFLHAKANQGEKRCPIAQFPNTAATKHTREIFAPVPGISPTASEDPEPDSSKH